MKVVPARCGTAKADAALYALTFDVMDRLERAQNLLRVVATLASAVNDRLAAGTSADSTVEIDCQLSGGMIAIQDDVLDLMASSWGDLSERVLPAFDVSLRAISRRRANAAHTGDLS